MATKKDTPAVVPAPEFHLIVIHPFDAYQRGQKLTNAGEIDAVMTSENAHHVRKVQPSAE